METRWERSREGAKGETTCHCCWRPAIRHNKLSSQLFKYVHSKLTWVFHIFFFFSFPFTEYAFICKGYFWAFGHLVPSPLWCECESSVTHSSRAVMLVVWITCMPSSGKVSTVSFRVWGRSQHCFGLFLARVCSLATLEGCRSLF